MLPYFSAVAPASEPEGWDAADILQLQNPATGRWSCPTLTKRNRRCENVVSQERSIKVKPMINSMSVEDPAVIVRDQKRELTDLAETMLCPLHFGGLDSGEKVKGVVAQWRNYIKTSMRTQAQGRTVRHRPTAPSVGYQPSRNGSDDIQRRNVNASPQRTSTIPEVQIRPWSVAVGTPSTPQSRPPNHGANIDQDAIMNMVDMFHSLMLQNQELTSQNQRLRAENAQLIEKGEAAAADHKRTEDVLEAVDEERNALSDQVDELYRETNSLRDREDRHLEKIAALEDAVQQTTRTYRRLKKVWTAASVVAKGEV